MTFLIRAVDVPEDLIQELADRLRIDTGMAADLLAHRCNVVAAAVVDFDAERYFDRTTRDLAAGRLDHYAPRNLPPRR